jgi:hypothetical protein
MSLVRRLAKLEGSLPHFQELAPVPEDLRAALRTMGMRPGRTTGGPVSVPALSPELRQALGAVSADLLKKRYPN